MCLASIAQKADKRILGHLVDGGLNLRNTHCAITGADSFQIDCSADPNKVATINIHRADTACAAGSPDAVELKIDEVCNEVQVPDGLGG